MSTTPTEAAPFIERVLSAMQMEKKGVSLTPMVQDQFQKVVESVSAEDRLLSGIAAVLFNVDPEESRFDKGKIISAIQTIDHAVNEQMNEILHSPDFQHLESIWTGLNDLCEHTNFKSNVAIDLLDVGKGELYDDFEANASDIFSSDLFRKIYIAEYDQYGGLPFSAMLGLYDFTALPRDLFWLRSMSKVAAAAHCPFVGSVSPQFFGCRNATELEDIRDLDGLLSQPKYGKWNQLRDAEEAAYLGLCFPRYVLRLPWNPETNPADGILFTEHASGDHDKYLWGSAVYLYARNLVRSFVESGWCQYIRGPRGGGRIDGLPVDTFNVRGQDEIKPPVEIIIPDFRELEFARNGFIPLVYRKGTSEATFFSVQSIKVPRKFKDPKDNENAQLVCNLAYTFSITRVAHYLKSINREYIGKAVDAGFLEKVISRWLNQYVTSTIDPDNDTMRVYPFKATSIKVVAKPGQIGWYDCKVGILPHIQFEGMDIELRLEARLG